MKTCVIIINYNKLELTEECLSSICGPLNPPHVVIVDNASNKGNIKTVFSKYENVTLIILEENIGFSRANNVGIKWAIENTNCEYIFLLNNDAYVDNNAISILEDYLNQHPDCDLCSPRIMISDMKDLYWYGGGEIDWKRGGAVSWKIGKPFDNCFHPVPVTFISACSMMIRKNVFLNVGGFDPRMFMYCEDIDFCARLKNKNYHMVYIPTAVIWHRCHASIREQLPYQLDFEVSPQNPKLAFVVENVICNTLLSFFTHAHGLERILGALYLMLRWSRNIIRYFIKRRVDGITAIFKGVLLFLEKRRIPFINELKIGNFPIAEIIPAKNSQK